MSEAGENSQTTSSDSAAQSGSQNDIVISTINNPLSGNEEQSHNYLPKIQEAGCDVNKSNDKESFETDRGLTVKSPTKNDNEEFAVPTLLSVPKKTDRHIQKPVQESTKTNSKSSEKPREFNYSEKQHPPIPYKEPAWSGLSKQEYNFEVLKNGSIIGNVSLNDKSHYIFGRLPSCDVTLEHPSLSRYHAVVQYSAVSTETHEIGWYIYDLDSTHGTWINKKKITPKVYHRLRVGYVVKFGGSSRLHILQGPRDDEDEESEMSVTELKDQKEKLQKEAELLRQADMQKEMERIEAEKKILEDTGCGWGMGEDAEDIVGEENPYSSLVPENESLYIDDPKKALKGFYDREGCDLPDYQFTEVTAGKHKCRLDLPVDGPNGEELVAEAVVSGKRKDAVIACALEACRILDKLGMLRSSTHESRKRKQKKWEDDDFYDSDEDTFLDRTGTIEKKRVMRMKKAGKEEPETYESLMEKYNNVTIQIQEIEVKLKKAKEEADARVSEEMDELDAYMSSIKAGAMDTKTRLQLKGELLRLKGEEQRLRKLVNIAKPATLPPLKLMQTPSSTMRKSDHLASKVHAQEKLQRRPLPLKKSISAELKPDNYEEEEEEEDDEEMEEEKHRAEKLKQDRLSPPVSISSVKPSSSTRVDHTDAAEQVKRQSSKPVVKGPFRPPWLNTDQRREQTKSSHPHRSSTAAVLDTLEKEQKETKQEESSNFSSDPNYVMWLPPADASGDGRTSLNDKLGY